MAGLLIAKSLLANDQGAIQTDVAQSGFWIATLCSTQAFVADGVPNVFRRTHVQPGISISRRALASLLIPQSIFLNRQYTWVLRSIGKSNDEIKILRNHHDF
jgi:hypothetical protein